MKCHDAEQLFDAFLDGELTGSLRLEFDAHRLRCQTCQRKLALLEACQAALSTPHREPELPANFTDRVMRTIEGRGPTHRTISLPLRVAATALPAAAIIALFAFILRPSEMSSDEPEALVSGHVTARQSPLDRAMEDPTGVELYSYIMEQLWQAKSNLARDVSELRKYAANLALSETREDRPLLSPLELLNGLLSAPVESDRPQPTSSDNYSL
jgi:hypothetical protein